MKVAFKWFRNSRFSRSRRALAIPITFLLLFVSTLILVSVTYAFAVERVNSQSQTVKAATSKENMFSLDEAVLAVMSQPGSSRGFSVKDSGGQFCVQPALNVLTLNVSDGKQINATIFNATIGQVSYTLPKGYSEYVGFYLKGDDRSIVNASGSVMSQLSVQNGAQHNELQLWYRPTVSYTFAGVVDNQAVTNLRIYVVNLNSSDPFSLFGSLPLRVSCESVNVTSVTYSVDYEPQNLQVTSTLNGLTSQVLVPISSQPAGANIHIEVVQCNLNVERSVS